MIMKSKTYYVSVLTGSDSNDGLTPSSPFKSLDKINETPLNPGDKVLLEKGSVFKNQYLHIKNCGDFEKDEVIVEICDDDNSEGKCDIDIGMRVDTLYDLIQAGLIVKE